VKRITIGIDISKQKFDVAYKQENQKWCRGIFKNNIEGFQEFLQWAKESQAKVIYGVMEATGRYGEELANFLYNSGCEVSIVNPSQIKNYSRCLLKRAKTDKVDAGLIYEFATKHEISLWKPLLPAHQALKEQVRCLNVFKEDLTQISNRLESAKDFKVIELLKEREKNIKEQIKALEEGLEESLEEQPELKKQVDLLDSIPGIAKTTALNILSELPDLSTLKNGKQLAAYAGLNPSIRSSGSSVRGQGSISRMGNRALRKALYFPALTLMSRHSCFKAFVEKLRSKGKEGKVIACAVMHKLMHVIFGVLTKQAQFDAETFVKNAG
jgi:transposase